MTLDVSQFNSGIIDNLVQFLNIFSILITFFVFQFEIADISLNDEQSSKIPFQYLIFGELIFSPDIEVKYLHP